MFLVFLYTRQGWGIAPVYDIESIPLFQAGLQRRSEPVSALLNAASMPKPSYSNLASPTCRAFGCSDSHTLLGPDIHLIKKMPIIYCLSEWT